MGYYLFIMFLLQKQDEKRTPVIRIRVPEVVVRVTREQTEGRTITAIVGETDNFR